jgi:hypothetical protein
MFSFVAEEAQLHEAARKIAGLDDFGGDDYLEGLRALSGALDEEARLNDIGVMANQGTIVETLVGRLYSERGFKAFPESADYAVKAPLVIIGQPRTASTALHHLIARDPGLQSLELWLASRPQVRPPREAWPQMPEFVACDRQTRAMYERSPDMLSIHEIAADLPDECWHLLKQHFAHSGYEALCHVPSYSRWWADYDMRPAYRRHLRNIQLIGHTEPERRWFLKDATHLFHFDAFDETYPDARVVQTHRDPVKWLPSVCSLCWSGRASLNEGEDKVAFGRDTLNLWDRAVHRMMEARARQDASRFHDVHFLDAVLDPVAAIQEIYERFSLPYTDDADRAIRAFRADNPPGKHGSHSYTLDEFGLNAGEIRERFVDYIEAYGIRSETG